MSHSLDAREPRRVNPLPSWPRSAPPSLSAALLRAQPEDFQVKERMSIVPTGSGEHLWLRVRKRGFNTEHVAKLLARIAGITRRDVGYAGMKDRHAVTEQWFSLHLAGRGDPGWQELPAGIEVLEAVRHNRKLKTGALAGNCFTLVLRECRGDAQALHARIEALRRTGVPNYFGEQRFGRDGANVAHAHAMFAGDQQVRDRHRHGLYLSAARSFLFNELLAARVHAGNWCETMVGEACLLAGTRSYFIAEQLDDELYRRLAAHDIHPSGPLWGRGEPPCRAHALALEQQVAAQYPQLTHGLEAAGLHHERRALRVVPEAIEVEPLGPDSWRLRFCLPAGSYATVVARELADFKVAGVTEEDNE